MAIADWGSAEQQRFEAIREPLARVSTATANHMLQMMGWRNTFAVGLSPLQPLDRGLVLVGRARTVRYLPRRASEAAPTTDEERAVQRAARRNSPEMLTIESLEPGDVFCVDAMGVLTAGIIGDILSARIKRRGAVMAVIDGVVRDSPYIRMVGLPVICRGAHPAASGRDVAPVDWDVPIHVAGVHVRPGDVVMADEDGALFLPLDLAEIVAASGPAKERLEAWIRGKIQAGGSVWDYYPPTPEKLDEYEREQGGAGG